MKKFISFLTSLFLTLFIALTASAVVPTFTGFSPSAVGIVTFVLFSIPNGAPAGVLGMAVQKELWVNYIVENLYKDNQWLEQSKNHDEYVMQGKVVHIPNAGAFPEAEKNREQVPAQVKRRDDIDLNYSLDEYTTSPIYIEDAEKHELSYDKIASIMGDEVSVLSDLTGDWGAYDWAPEGDDNIIRTTGDAVEAHLDGATGNRKKFTVNDLKKAQLKMNKMNVPKKDRNVLMSSDMLDQFTDSLTISQERDFSKAYDEKTGVVGKLFGFTFYERSTVVRYTNASTPVKRLPTAAGASTDNDAVICWQKESVAKAKGEVKFFEDIDNPQYYGDLYSALLRFKANKHRQDQKGIIAIVQAAA